MTSWCYTICPFVLSLRLLTSFRLPPIQASSSSNAVFSSEALIQIYQPCKIVEGQRYSKRLNEKQNTALLKVTCQRPKDREQDNANCSVLMKCSNHNAFDQDPYAKEFGIRISEKLASVEARILPTP
ncbi:hypothetical protein F8388_015919 [Cannabis sativa]|uniref:Argonaute linker 2 domain-containing protein n=1 Tax=Cannabis sativa TaxID=3483 RepID=A0A7J6EEP4_CANSA|nr:hypothetical protein F8388_015919 [Cannabis sativa]